MSLERIDKLLSHEGFGTRKGVKKLLRVSEVLVNGNRVTDSGFTVNPDKDEISVDGQVLNIKKNLYIMMNKKCGYVSANKDGLHPTVFDLLSDEYRTVFLQENLHLVGRLDMDTEGLLLFTTDGKFIHKATAPKTHLPKSYFVRIKKAENLQRQKTIEEAFKGGIRIPREDNEDEADCKPADIEWSGENECILTITEGKYHQVKRMFRAVDNEVVYLKRLSIGSLKLDENLALGEFRELSDQEVEALQIFPEK
ncbi:MAG: rRNA pseudouridine synthase [Treponema sp.]|nr:rRNA pseudouridine synthase [Treponema sp.]